MSDSALDHGAVSPTKVEEPVLETVEEKVEETKVAEAVVPAKKRGRPSKQ